MGKRQSKSILDIETPYKERRNYGFISCLNVLMKRFNYLIKEKEVEVTYTGPQRNYVVLTIKRNDATNEWNVVEDLHFFHEASKSIKLPYNYLLNHIVESAKKKWGNMK